MISTINFARPQTTENLGITGTRTSMVLSTECSGGHLTIIEEDLNVGVSTPAQICNREDKVIFVTDGKFALFANGKKYEADKGCNIFIPHGILHHFKNVGTQTGKLLITLTPCSHNNFIKGVRLSIKVFEKDPAVMQNVAKRHGVILA